MQSIPPMYDESDGRFRLRLKVQPRALFVRTTLHLLDDTEERIGQQGKTMVEDIEAALRKLEATSGKKTDSASDLHLHPDEDISGMHQQRLSTRQNHLVALPLNARYAALVSAMAGLEWLVRSMHAAHRDDLAEFAEDQAHRKHRAGDAAAVRKFREMAGQGRRIQPGRVVESLRRMAERANLRGGASEVFSNLCVARNAVVHCGGEAEEFNEPDKLRQAIDRLDGFELVEGEVDVDGEQFEMPLAEGMSSAVAGEQIWIKRGALNGRVMEALGFIEEIYETIFGG